LSIRTITCSKSNEGSRKSIVKNGGVYSHDFLDEGEEEPEEIYGIKLDEKLKIKNYQTGEEFLKENGEYLKTNQYMSSFFFFDAPLIKESNLKDYALCVEKENKKLLAIKVGYYPLIVFGEKELAPYLVNYIYTNNLELTKFLGETSLCEAIKDAIRLIQGKKFFEHLAMEFMDCRKVNGEISFEVEKPTLDDLDEICECMANFSKECGLNDPIDREKYASRINDYRVIKIDGKIASIGYYHQSTDISCHVSCVYTRDEYRGRNLARKVVTTMTNEILNKGYIASLNVDKNNPITNHLYRSIGYAPVFSQSEFDEEK